jgi:hypothetical protein
MTFGMGPSTDAWLGCSHHRASSPFLQFNAELEEMMANMQKVYNRVNGSSDIDGCIPQKIDLIKGLEGKRAK